MKIYLAGKITGLPEQEYMGRFLIAENYLTEQGLEESPQYFKLYHAAMEKYISKRPEILDKYGWRDVDDAMRWWLSGKATKIRNQIEMDFEE